MKPKTFPQIILDFLKSVKEATPTQIRDNTKIHYDLIKFILLDLEAKGKIIKRMNVRGTFVYWRLKK
jgi:predicted transcriptional regulator